ncbi:MAG: hypothetical protein ACE14L_11270 [Terriglobales bacterium]
MAVAIAVIVLAIVAFRSERRRRQQLAQLATEMGFTYSELPETDLAHELPRVPLAGLQVDADPEFRNVMRGSAAGCEVIIADRVITRGVGRSRGRSVSTVAAFKLAADFPPFILAPENFVWRAVEKLAGMADIDIEGAPEFSRRFFLHGQDETAVRAVFTPAVVQACEQLDGKSGLCVIAAGRWLLVSRPGDQVAAVKVRDFLEQAIPFVQVFAAHTHSGFGWANSETRN